MHVAPTGRWSLTFSFVFVTTARSARSVRHGVRSKWAPRTGSACEWKCGFALVVVVVCSLSPRVRLSPSSLAQGACSSTRVVDTAIAILQAHGSGRPSMAVQSMSSMHQTRAVGSSSKRTSKPAAPARKTSARNTKAQCRWGCRLCQSACSAFFSWRMAVEWVPEKGSEWAIRWDGERITRERGAFCSPPPVIKSRFQTPSDNTQRWRLRVARAAARFRIPISRVCDRTTILTRSARRCRLFYSRRKSQQNGVGQRPRGLVEWPVGLYDSDWQARKSRGTSALVVGGRLA